MEIDPSLKAKVQTEIDVAQKDTRDSFYIWWWVNVILGACIIVMPLLGTFASPDVNIIRIYAAIGSASAGMYAFIKPDRLASAYDWACQHVWKTDIDFNCGKIDSSEVAVRLSEAVSATTFTYVAVDANKGAAKQKRKPSLSPKN